MWNEEYVVSVKTPIVKIDRYIVNNIQEDEQRKYEFNFNFDVENLKQITTFDSKKILIATYNLGKMIEKKFTVKNNDVETNNKQNIFRIAQFYSQKKFYSKLKEIGNNIDSEIDMSKKDISKEEKKELIHKKVLTIERNLYQAEITNQLDKNRINNKDYQELLILIKKWIKTCGLTNKEIELPEDQRNLFSIILLSHQIYLFIENGVDNLEANLVYTLKRENSSYMSEVYVETINDLIYFLTMNYFEFKRNGYIICEICGKMIEGNKKRKTCSEKCKKERQNRNKQKL